LRTSTKAHQVFLFADCQQAVVMARSGQCGPSGAYWEMVKEIECSKRDLRQHNHTVNIRWIPGHTANPQNNLADQLAKKAALLSATLPSAHPDIQRVKRPFLLARSFVRRRLNYWKGVTWLQSSKGRQLHALHRDPAQGQPKNQVSLPRSIQVAISRLRIGNAITNRSRYQMGLANSPDCSHCPGTIDTPEHRIIHCPKYKVNRCSLVARCSSFQLSPLTMQGLLAPEGTTKEKKGVTSALVTFLEKTNLLDLFNWRSP